MVAMPYILVNLVLGAFSLLLFGVTSAALITGLFLGGQPRSRRTFVFVALALALSVLPIVGLHVAQRAVGTYVSPQPLYDLLFLIGLINSVVLAYRFLNTRWLLDTPKVRRRLALSVASVVVAVVPALAVVAMVYRLCVIR